MITDRMDAAQAALSGALSEWEASKDERTDSAIEHILADLEGVERRARRLRSALEEEQAARYHIRSLRKG